MKAYVSLRQYSQIIRQCLWRYTVCDNTDSFRNKGETKPQAKSGSDQNKTNFNRICSEIHPVFCTLLNSVWYLVGTRLLPVRIKNAFKILDFGWTKTNFGLNSYGWPKNEPISLLIQCQQLKIGNWCASTTDCIGVLHSPWIKKYDS